MCTRTRTRTHTHTHTFTFTYKHTYSHISFFGSSIVAFCVGTILKPCIVTRIVDSHVSFINKKPWEPKCVYKRDMTLHT